MIVAVTIEEYQRIKAAAEKARRAADRARGERDGIVKKIREEYGCNTPAAAKATAVKLGAAADAALAAYEAALAKFKTDWPDILGGDDGAG